MSNRTVIRTKIISGDVNLSHNDRELFTDADKREELKKEMNNESIVIQNKIDEYNFKEIFNINKFFEGLQLNGNDVIVRLFKENYIKDVIETGGLTPTFECNFTQVNVAKEMSGQQRWQDNPFPYITMGVIVCISKTLQSKQLNIKKELNENGIEYRPYKVGDIVMLDTQAIREPLRYMFYIDRNDKYRDYFKNAEEWSVQQYEGYIRIGESIIDGLWLKDNIPMSSPYYNYKKKMNNND